MSVPEVLKAMSPFKSWIDASRYAHERMTIYYSGRFAFENASFGADIWFSFFNFVCGEEAGGDVYFFCKGVEVFELGHLRGVLGDDPFLSVAVGDFFLLAEIVEHVLA